MKRHGFVLGIAGFMYVAYGTLVFSYRPGTPRYEGLRAALDVLPIHIWGIVFVAVGATSILCAFISPGVEYLGYGLITGLAAGWSATYFAGVLAYHSDKSNLAVGVWWALNALLWWSISGLLNPRARNGG